MRRGFTTSNPSKGQEWKVEDLSFRSLNTLNQPYKPLYIGDRIIRQGFKQRAVNERNSAIKLHDSFRNERLGQKVHIVNEQSKIADLQSKDEAKQLMDNLITENQDAAQMLSDDVFNANQERNQKLSEIRHSIENTNNPDLSGLTPQEQKNFHNTFTARRKDGSGRNFRVGGQTWNKQITDHGLHSVAIHPVPTQIQPGSTTATPTITPPGTP